MSSFRFVLISAVLTGATELVLPGVTAGQPSESVEFSRDIRPILSENCFQCHGPDDNHREAELRFDTKDGAFVDLGGYRSLVPGDPDASAVFRRIMAQDEDARMPPAESGKRLHPEQIELIRGWIQQGARWQDHWSFVSPRRPNPAETGRDRLRNPIDCFVLSRLRRENLKPSPRADKATLIRRVTLDLTGLPPALDEINAFLAADSPDAYDRIVARLLASPRYGEHMARYWLDAARYADTNGFFVDSERFMWRWRDWVIDAFNSNMPYDRFTVEQLAGDLLPNATLDQKIASGFNRNHMTTHEGGVIDEEYRVEYVVDRVKTTSTVWMGLTMGCARCHDHKYDPITQKEFYQFFAFFNNVPEKGNTGRDGNALPVLKVPSADEQVKLKAIRRTLATAEKDFKTIEKDLDRGQAKWEASVAGRPLNVPTKGLLAHYEFEQSCSNSTGAGHQGIVDGPVRFEPGMLGHAASFDGQSSVAVADGPDFERTDSFSIGAWIHLASGQPVCVVSKVDELNFLRGFDIMYRKGRVTAHLIHRWNGNAIQVTTKDSVPTRRWQHVMITYDGSSKAAGLKLFINGKLQNVIVNHDSLNGTIRCSQPTEIGRRGTGDLVQGMIDDLRFYDRRLTEAEVEQLATNQLVTGIAGKPPGQRTSAQQQRLREHYIDRYAAPDARKTYKRLKELRKQQSSLAANLPTTMVMQELDSPRDAFVLLRGQYDQHGEKVRPGVPASLPSLPAAGSSNRLALAQWLVDPSHPLTARVLVNRLWQQHFGVGIVKTSEDFGSQGEPPSHPELLDWLAVELVESGWDIKHLQRRIVTSATYQQSSEISDFKSQVADSHSNPKSVDPENRLLSRGPRYRMDAEMVRDHALAISGLLVDRIGGRSVKPYQPSGLWEAVSYDGNLSYERHQGAGLYRRSMYTFWKRQSPPPSMLAFDGPTRETCTVRRSRTNTPVQALVLMNDTTFVEAARQMAERMMIEGGPKPIDRLRFGYRLATGQWPSSRDVDVLAKVYNDQRQEYQRDEMAAVQLLNVGQSKPNRSLDPDELATWTVVAHTILNMNKTITKE